MTYVRRCSRCAHQVRHQPLVSRHILAHHYHHISHFRVLTEHCFDLAQLDPEAPHLHLLVHSSQILQLSIVPVPHLVSSPVQPRASRGAKRVRHKPLRRLLRPSQIPARQPGSSHIQLSRHSYRHYLHPPVQHVQLEVWYRSTDQTSPSLLHLCCRQPFVSHMHGRLRDPVHVHQLRLLHSMPRYPTPQTPQLQRFTAEDHYPQLLQLQPATCHLFRLHQLPECRRRLVQHRHSFVAQQLIERFRRPAHQIRHHHQTAAVQQCSPYLPH